MKYCTMVADPPWEYSKGFANAIGAPHLQDRLRGAKNDTPIVCKPPPYPTLSVETICSLPVPSLAADDCRLFLWATNRYLPDAFRVLAAWGFGYKQTLVWDKTLNFSPFGGSVAPNASEFLLVACRGRPPVLSRWRTSVISARHGRTVHSVKPEVFLDLAETVSPGPYLELFARRNRLGWDTWGNEALEHVRMNGDLAKA